MPFAWQALLGSVCHSVWLCLCVSVCVCLCVCVSHAFKCFPKLPFSHLAAWPIPTELMLLPPSLSSFHSFPPTPLPLLCLIWKIALRRLSTAVSHSGYLLIHFMHLFNVTPPPPHATRCSTLPIPFGTARCDSFAWHAFFFSHFA